MASQSRALSDQIASYPAAVKQLWHSLGVKARVRYGWIPTNEGSFARLPRANATAIGGVEGQYSSTSATKEPNRECDKVTFMQCGCLSYAITSARRHEMALTRSFKELVQKRVASAAARRHRHHARRRPRGNPQARNLFGIIGYLQKQAGVELHVGDRLSSRATMQYFLIRTTRC